MLLETIILPIDQLKTNEGQIPDVPANPRIIKSGKFRKLMQSIKDDPEMMSLRELIVYPYEKQFIVIGGNMRLKACIELGKKELPCKVLHPKVTPTQLRAIIQKDNIAYGENDWDELANNPLWDLEELKHWGMDIPKDWGTTFEEQTQASHEPPRVSLTIEFETLDVYQDVKQRVSEVIEEYEGVSIKN